MKIRIFCALLLIMPSLALAFGVNTKNGNFYVSYQDITQAHDLDISRILLLILTGYESLTNRMYCVWLGVMLILLAGCNSPNFVNPPPNNYLAPLPNAINGTWANEVENGERVRLSGQPDGVLRFYFFHVGPSDEPVSAEPLLAQTIRFDNSDWLLLDMSKLSAWQGETYTEKAPFIFLKYTLENPDRLCGTEMDTHVFVEAIKSGQLAGTFELPDPKLPVQVQSTQVTVTTSGADWVKWWSALPESKKTFGRTFCFLRVKE